jgi:hypothetical protein
LPGRSGNNVKNRWHKHLSKTNQAIHIDGLGQEGAVPIVAEAEKPVINLCEAIGVKDCDLAAIFTQLGGHMQYSSGSYWTFSHGESFL